MTFAKVGCTQPIAMRLVEPGVAATAHYRILVSRAEQRPQADLYGFTLREPIPPFPLPLKDPEEPVKVDLQPLIKGIYQRGGCGIRIDCQAPMLPPALSAVDQAWVAEMVRPSLQ